MSDTWDEQNKHIKGYLNSEYEHFLVPPPELPLHFSKKNIPSRKEPHGKALIKKVKNWWGNNDEYDKNVDEENINKSIDMIYIPEVENEYDKWQRLLLRSDVGHKKNILNDEYGHNGVNNSPNGVNSAKTFLTGNITNANNVPSFPNFKLQEDVEYLDHIPIERKYDSECKDLKSSKDNIQEPITISHLHFKKHNLSNIKKKLALIANQKEEVFKAEQKFLRELNIWKSSISTLDEYSLFLIDDIKELFQQDSISEQKISHNLKDLVKNLEYVSKRENEYIIGNKNVQNELKYLQHIIEKNGKASEETNFQKEKLTASRKSFEETKKNFQQSISINMRNYFKDLALIYHDSLSDLRDSSTKFIQKSLKALAIINTESFDEDLNNFKINRVQKKWSKLTPTRKKDPNHWNNMMSGLHDNEDSLLRNVYKGLPQEYSPTRKALEPYSKKEQKSPLNESFSDITTKRFNPITTNQYFNEKSPVLRKEEENIDPNRDSYDITNKNILLPPGNKNIENKLRKKNSTVTKDNPKADIIKQVFISKDIVDKNKSINNITEGINGYVLNFGEISQQMQQAEVYLEENNWAD